MFYDQFVKFILEKSSETQLYARCPFHSDSNASFTVNKDTKEWYCHGCAVGGSEVVFLEHWFDISKTIAQSIYATYKEKKIFPFPTEEYVEKCEKELQIRKDDLQKIRELGITDSIIKQFQIGWEDTRLIIPVRSRTNYVVNLRKYLPEHRRAVNSTYPKMIQLKGLGEARFFPYCAFDEQKIIIVEGEKDCLIARSQGLNAVTGTGGANIPITELGLFAKKDVLVMTDSDAPGRKICKAYIQGLKGVANSVVSIKLPLKDFAEYWQKYKNIDIEQYIESCDMKVKDQTLLENTSTSISLKDSENTTNLNTWFRLESMCIVGADPKTYTIPSKLKVVCRDQTCTKACPIGALNSSYDIEVDPRQLLQFVESSDSVQDNYLKTLFGCKSITAEPAEYINVQKIMFQESASFIDGLEDSSFEMRYGIYLFDSDRLVPTVKYDFETCRVSDPRNQQNYYVIRNASQASQGTVGYIGDAVTYFKNISSKYDTFEDLLNFHYSQWKPLLGIEGRSDLFGAILLTYLSVTEVQWNGGTFKGWLDSMVIGDTRTGKSQMVQRFVKAIGMGSYVNGENARRTGIIGGVQRFGDSWVITWGAIPMNDKGLLIIDEASGLEIGDIKELSATRSSGAVTINKIAKGEAKARTRLLWLSNPRSGRNLEDFYWKGYGAFTEFIPVAEDQARFDLVLTAAREDVQEVSERYSNDFLAPIQLWQDIINYAWTIPKELCNISSETQQEIRKSAKHLAEHYEGGPLVVAVAVHEKLLRLSCSIAILCGSVLDTRELIVLPKHAQYAQQFLEACYVKESLDYRGYITEAKRAQRNRVENTKHVRALCTLYPALKVLISSDVFRGSQVREVLGIDGVEASKIVSDLLKRGLLKISGSGAYKPDKSLIDIAKQMEVDV